MEQHIADTTAATMTEKEKSNLSLKAYSRRHRFLLLALALWLGYSLIQMKRVDGFDARYQAVEPPAAYRCPTDGNIYRSWLEHKKYCPSFHRI